VEGVSVTKANDAVTWEQFVVDVSEIAHVSATEIAPETRIIEDLGCDSFSLAELVLALIEDYEMEELSDSLGERIWDGVSVGKLYEAFTARGGQARGATFKFSMPPSA
jgi:acyl carrier protein